MVDIDMVDMDMVECWIWTNDGMDMVETDMVDTMDIFQVWIFFKGEYLLGVNIFQG